MDSHLPSHDGPGHHALALLPLGAALIDPAAAAYAPLPRTASEDADDDADVAAAAPDDEDDEDERAKTTTSRLRFPRSAWDDPDDSLTASCCFFTLRFLRVCFCLPTGRSDAAAMFCCPIRAWLEPKVGENLES